MQLHEKVFWGLCFFLTGVVFASGISAFDNRQLITVVATILVGVGFLLFSKKWFAVLSLAILLGASYYFWSDIRYQQSFNAPFNQRLTFIGLVESVSTAENQTADIELQSSYSGKIRVYADLQPVLTYGDVIRFSGTLKPVPADNRGYYAKEGISATLSYPKNLTVLESGKGSAVKSVLFGFRDRVQESFKKVLPEDEATFMTGLTLGKSAGFSKAFKQKLSDTGTTHLVALSGYNISVIASGVALLLGYWFSRRVSFVVGVVAIILFVTMTGAEASVVRAAIMAIIMLIADRTGRLFVVKNAIVIAAFLMVLVNPRVLVFDVGFQLSFMALLGIIYLKPALERLFNISGGNGFLNWRGNILTTLAAQMAVLPILMSAFGFFSILSLATNILILGFIPLTMLLGLLIFLSSIVSYYMSFFFGVFGRILLRYELSVIDIFSKIPVGIHLQSFPIGLSALYYISLVGFILYEERRRRKVI